MEELEKFLEFDASLVCVSYKSAEMPFETSTDDSWVVDVVIGDRHITRAAGTPALAIEAALKALK